MDHTQAEMMKSLLKIGLIGVVLAGGLAAAYAPMASYLRMRNQPLFRAAEVSRGDVTEVVNSTGTVKPVLTVQIGSFVSGPILEMNIDFNERVQKDQVLAKIDPLIYKSNLDRDEAIWLTRVADVERVQALLQLARNDEKRSKALREKNKDFISDAEMDQFRFNRMSLEAQLQVADATVKQAKGSLDNSKANLGYTEIKSPVDGIVIDRKIQQGQTVAAQFQTPELFTIAPEMEKKMHVYASVDEADIGLIRGAQLRKQPVSFTVDAYPDTLFEGEIEQVRMSSTTTQNVVTYPVVVAAPNAELKLLPGMTASLSFLVEKKQEVLRIPNAALRFYPDVKMVRSEDQALLDGSMEASSSSGPAPGETVLSAMEKAEAGKSRNRRHVWVEDNGLLRAVEVVTGISDSKNTELVSGPIQEGDSLVTGIQPPKTN